MAENWASKLRVLELSKQRHLMKAQVVHDDAWCLEAPWDATQSLSAGWVTMMATCCMTPENRRYQVTFPERDEVAQYDFG